MVGGTVIEVIERGDRLWVNTSDPNYPRDTCALYVKWTPESDQIREGDSFWWDQGHAYWTPRDRHVQDMPLPRVGYSGVPRP